MGSVIYILCVITTVFLFRVQASLTIPSEMISPLGVPDSMGPAGMTAVKLAVGSRLLNMLGSVGLGSIGSLPGGLLRPGMGSEQLLGAAFSQLLPITARSKEFTRRRGPSIPTSFDIRKATPQEVENFFGVLHKVDANKCISRLVCEVGANPRVLEGLGHNIKDVMNSLQILEKNALSTKYREILQQGQKDGFDSCKSSFTTCDDKSYRLVRTFVRAFKVRN